MKSKLTRFLKMIASKLLSQKAYERLGSAYYARSLKSLDESSEPDFQIIKRLVGKSEHVADVGANVGDYTKFLSDLVGPGGLVYSVEPVPRTYAFLKSNVERLKLTNVRAFNCAVSDANGTVTMEIPTYKDGHENFYQARIITDQDKKDFRHVTVDAKRLDLILKDILKTVTFIKCDVEGHELQCLHGSSEILSGPKPAWLIEFSSDPDLPNSDASKVSELLTNAGYHIYWFDGVVLRPRQAKDHSVNYFFFTNSHVERLKDSIAR